MFYNMLNNQSDVIHKDSGYLAHAKNRMSRSKPDYPG